MKHLFVFLLLTASFSTVAAATEDKASARAHYDEATKFYNLSEYPKALDEFRAAYLAKPDPAFLFNIAQCHRMMGDPEGAAKFYRAFLRERPNTANRKDVEGFIAESEAEEKRRAGAAARPAPPALTTEPTKPPVLVPPPPPAVAAPTAPIITASTPEPLPTPTPTRKPLYKQWWFWTATGAVAVAAGAVVIGVVAAPHEADVPSTSLGSMTVNFN